MKILIVKNNEKSEKNLQKELIKHNFVVDIAEDSENAWQLLHSFIYDLVLVEISLPKIDGISLCQRLRTVGNLIQIILITDTDSTCIAGLNIGADDCLLKPINHQELLARIHAIGRRGLKRAKPVLSWGPLQLNPISRQVTCNQQILKVSRKEYQLLELFLQHPRQMFTRSAIADRLWNLDQELPTDATIKSHIRSIRRKLEKTGINNLIETLYGHGYRLNLLFDRSKLVSQNSMTQSESSMDQSTAQIWHELMEANVLLQEEIEARKQIENQLRRSELLLRNAQKAAHIGAWEFDIRTLETYWTEELYHIHGLDPDQPAPNREQVLNLIHPDDRQLHQTAIVIPATQGKAFDVNLRIIRQDGEIRYINARGGPVFDESGQVIKLTGTTFDITDFNLNY
jgi:PAS domain S-box-containing protein